MLARSEIHETFCKFCFRAQGHNIVVGRYVLMPDHVHLVVGFPEEDIALERWIQGLRSVIGKRLFTIGFDKPHWQEGFFDHILLSHESYSEKSEYVRANPVRAGLSKTPEEWPDQGEIINLPFD